MVFPINIEYRGKIEQIIPFLLSKAMIHRVDKVPIIPSISAWSLLEEQPESILFQTFVPKKIKRQELTFAQTLPLAKRRRLNSPTESDIVNDIHNVINKKI